MSYSNTSPTDQPAWACKRWGYWEHDWLDCPDCLTNYETYLEQSTNARDEQAEAASDDHQAYDPDFAV